MRRRTSARGALLFGPLVPKHIRLSLRLAPEAGSHSSRTCLVHPALTRASCAVLPGEVHGHVVIARLHLRCSRRGAQHLPPRHLLGMRLRLRCTPRFRFRARPGGHSCPEPFHALPGSGGPPSGHGAAIIPFVIGRGLGLSRPAAAHCQPRPFPEECIGCARSTENQSGIDLGDGNGVRPSSPPNFAVAYFLKDLRMCVVPRHFIRRSTSSIHTSACCLASSVPVIPLTMVHRLTLARPILGSWSSPSPSSRPSPLGSAGASASASLVRSSAGWFRSPPCPNTSASLSSISSP